MSEIMDQKPVINLITNFDAKIGTTINFVYLGSKKTTRNGISIREDTNQGAVVYTSEVTKFDKNYDIPAGALTNGQSYKIKVRVYTEEDGWGEWSLEASFICLATPKITFDNIDNKKFIYNDDVMMVAIYRQEQGERVINYKFSLLDQNKVPISVYPTRIPDPSSPTVFQERVDGLVKGQLYYISCNVITKNGLNYTEIKEFIPQYIAPSVNSILEVSNHDDSGQVLVQAYLKQLLGTQVKPYIPYAANDNPENYVYIGGEWIVIPPEMPLYFTRLGMAKASDWMAKIWCKNVINGVMLDFSKEYGEDVHMKFIKYDDYIVCEKELNGIRSRTRSNIVEGLGLKEFFLYIKVIEFRVEMVIVPK